MPRELRDNDVYSDRKVRNRVETQNKNVYTRVIPTYVSTKRMKKGIENALILDSIDLAPYYTSKTKEGDYGENKIISEFNKMDCCEYICSLDNSTLSIVFTNLKTVIESLVKLFEEK